jgi:L-ascorbate metabolism protein UlaG (beta-lactamase superfamily)
MELHLEYEDSSALGTMISGQIESRLKRRFRSAIAMLQRNARETIERAPSILAELGLNGSLSGELVFPDPTDTRPAVPDLAAWFGEWQRDAAVPASEPARELWQVLRDLDCFGPAREPAKLHGVATFVGHAAVLLSSARTTILVDPFLLPREEGFPSGYQPLTHGDFAPDAILVTHSHQDHFHVDSLLRLGKDTPIFVPVVPRESALAVDMMYRLKELGFSHVRPLGWYEETRIGDFRIITLPLYGEQPTTEAVPSPATRNFGNNYVIEVEGRRYALIADAGRDHLGDVRSLAVAAVERYGPVDVLFGGYRSFSLYPIQYALTSVPQYLLFTPPSLWGARQQIMNDAHALLDTAERWRARYVVPYADGGAPWYWQLGLGPRMDGSERPTNAHFDPRPEAVVRAAAARSDGESRPIASPVATLMMRPGESLDFDAQGAAAIVPNEGHLWPYAASDAVLTMPGATAEPEGLSRKRVLLRILAKEEIARRGLAVSAEQLMEMSDELRRDNGLTDHAQMLAWLERADLSMAEYCEILLEWQGVIKLEEAMADAIEKRLAGQRAFASMRNARRP